MRSHDESAAPVATAVDVRLLAPVIVAGTRYEVGSTVSLPLAEAQRLRDSFIAELI